MLLSRAYDALMRFSRRRQALWWLSFVSVIEAIFFPIPPDTVLTPMVLARRQRRHAFLWLALLTTLTSVAGGIIGYWLGWWLNDSLAHWLQTTGYQGAYNAVMDAYRRYDELIVLLSGFTPLPYKVFAVGAGAAQLSLPLFVLWSLIGRGARFFLLAALLQYFGDALEKDIRRTIYWIGCGCVVLAAAYFLWHIGGGGIVGRADGV